jgi:hypothetical protein
MLPPVSRPRGRCPRTPGSCCEYPCPDRYPIPALTIAPTITASHLTGTRPTSHSPGTATPEAIQARFNETLFRGRPKELAHDHWEREQSTDPSLVAGPVVAEWEKTRKPDRGPSASPTNDFKSRQPVVTGGNGSACSRVDSATATPH